MQSLKRSRFLHCGAYGALYAGRGLPKQVPHRLDALLEAANNARDSQCRKPFAKTYFSSAILQKQILDVNAIFRPYILAANPHPHASRSLSGVTVTSAAEPTKASPLSATSNEHFGAALRHYGQCYWEISKARLSMLVVTTAGAGYIMGSGLAINMYGLSWTCLGTFCAAAAANAINQVLEVENDGKMKRTNRRPLPSGRISTEHAMIFAAATSVTGVSLLASQANMVAAGLGAINLVLYTLVYTPLKQIHPVNTWVGAVVGAVPPLLGWAAAAGEVSMGGWVLASALYFWQIPHFMAIAYLCRQDYAAGGFKMLSIQDESGQRTALAALRNCAYLVPVGYMAYNCGLTTEWFGIETALLSAGMGATAALFYRKPSTEGAKKLFRISLLYLPILLTAMLAHRLPNEHKDAALSASRAREVSNTGLVLEEEREEELMKGIQVARPPAAFFSVAPFPFLPVPDL